MAGACLLAGMQDAAIVTARDTALSLQMSLEVAWAPVESLAAYARYRPDFSAMNDTFYSIAADLFAMVSCWQHGSCCVCICICWRSEGCEVARACCTHARVTPSLASCLFCVWPWPWHKLACTACCCTGFCCGGRCLQAPPNSLVNIQLAPSGWIYSLHPMAGNMRAYGLDVFNETTNGGEAAHLPGGGGRHLHRRALVPALLPYAAWRARLALSLRWAALQ